MRDFELACGVVGKQEAEVSSGVNNLWGLSVLEQVAVRSTQMGHAVSPNPEHAVFADRDDGLRVEDVELVDPVLTRLPHVSGVRW